MLGSYSSSSLPSADEDSIRFMDDIEENIGADTAQGMCKNRIKNCRIFFEIPAMYLFFLANKEI